MSTWIASQDTFLQAEPEPASRRAARGIQFDARETGFVGVDKDILVDLGSDASSEIHKACQRTNYCFLESVVPCQKKTKCLAKIRHFVFFGLSPSASRMVPKRHGTIRDAPHIQRQKDSARKATPQIQRLKDSARKATPQIQRLKDNTRKTIPERQYQKGDTTNTAPERQYQKDNTRKTTPSAQHHKYSA
ncbi:hypothetical protein BD560DRAFT_487248 [Blakeslea trispora]|nr:hypothetical protein BD560DRAFT_487248 [Blakeslea trispora]